jgi:putative lipoprotein
VKGTIKTQELAELPAGAMVNVQLQDTSRADAPAIVLGEQVIQNPEQFPIPFEITYDPAQIDERKVYSMRVRIEVEGKLIFINTTAHHVITRGNPTELEVIVEKVTPYSPPGLAEALENATWILMSYGEPANLQAVLEDTEITAAFDSENGQVTGSAGCNSYFGGYELKGNELSLTGPIGSTMMSCGEEIDQQEIEYLQILQDAESYEIDGNQLQINSGDKVLIFKVK